MLVRRLFRHAVITFLCCAVGACQRGNSGVAGDRSEKAPAAAPAASATPTSIFTGVASCSARSCHGGLEPRPKPEIGQDEYSKWLTHDQHVRAFQVLFEERSERIARNLGA